MGIALDAARMITQSQGLISPIPDADLAKVYRKLGLRVLLAPSTLPVREFQWGWVVGIRRDQPAPWRRWLKGHALGHVLLHSGDQATMSDRVLIAKQERQAELFAGWLFLSDTYDKMPAWELAEYHCLPQERIECWLGLVSGDMAVSAGS